ncbi:hypothetical protein H6F98_12725 [Microcoleus sp. FACHB-SPT15]|uniref:hypothetical protein n=1 Tax=Microcoleus sp. FACHB-SPT15 TaxID=2692830 RepID=UPI001786047B|nr:hypothetical protein [Microcoleus sp. FACHB-SPT15]MBD1806311.1 hypothetical protein [Microcoleus sp. FACHB-SPT15]
MATNKPQVLAYLHTPVYERLAEFKQEHGIQSLSRAVEIVLCDYFGIKAQGVLLPVGLEKSRNCTDKDEISLEMKVAVLSLKYEYLRDALAKLANEPNTTLQQFSATTSSVLTQPNQIEFKPADRTSLPSSFVLPKGLSTEVVKKGLTGTALAKRLNSSSSTVSNKRSKPDFCEWSMALDQDGIAWEYRSATRRFHPIELKK